MVPQVARNLSPAITAVPVNNPPAGFRARQFQWSAGGSTITSVAAGQLVVSVDNPPQETWAELPAIMAAWLPPPYVPQVSPKLPQGGITPPQVDQPPMTATPNILILDDPRLPQTGAKFPVNFVAPVVNNPPFSHLGRAQREVMRAWQPLELAPQTGAKFPVNFVAPVVNNPPFSHNGRAQREVFRAWQPLDPAPQRTGPFAVIPPSQVDIPPNTAGPKFVWIEDQPLPQVSRKLPQPGADNPPFGQRQFNWEYFGDPVVVTIGRNDLIPVITVSTADPPPVRRGGEQRLVAELWKAPDPAPQLPWHLNPAFEGVRVDNPPFHRVGELRVLFDHWKPLDPAPQEAAQLDPSITDSGIPLVLPPSGLAQRTIDAYRRALNYVGQPLRISVRRYTGTGAARTYHDTPIRARAIGLQDRELTNAMLEGALHIIALATDLSDAGFALPLRHTDKLVIAGQECAITDLDSDTRRVNGTLIAYDLKVKG